MRANQAGEGAPAAGARGPRRRARRRARRGRSVQCFRARRRRYARSTARLGLGRAARRATRRRGAGGSASQAAQLVARRSGGARAGRRTSAARASSGTDGSWRSFERRLLEFGPTDARPGRGSAQVQVRIARVEQWRCRHLVQPRHRLDRIPLRPQFLGELDEAGLDQLRRLADEEVVRVSQRTVQPASSTESVDRRA